MFCIDFEKNLFDIYFCWKTLCTLKYLRKQSQVGNIIFSRVIGKFLLEKLLNYSVMKYISARIYSQIYLSVMISISNAFFSFYLKKERILSRSSSKIISYKQNDRRE